MPMEKVAMKIVLNKWNNKKYLVVEADDKLVTLRREDDTEFQITWREFKEAYKEAYRER